MTMIESDGSRSAAWPPLHRERRALVVVDVVESVRLMVENEEDAVRRWQSFVAEVRQQLLPTFGGSLVKSLGDGMLLAFQTTRQAVECAMLMPDCVALGNAGLPSRRRMQLRIGVHAAEVVVDELDLYGSGVNLTARLAGLAGPDQIVVSAEGRDELTEGLDASFDDLGECFLKHIEQPVRAFRLSAPELRKIDRQFDLPVADLRPTVAVIPLSAVGDDAFSHIAGDLVADELIYGLSAADSLNVISRLSTAAFRNRNTPLAEIAAALSANYILTGSVSKQGTGFTLQLELSDVLLGATAWRERLHCRANDLCEIGSGVLTGLVSSVAAAIVNRELARVLSQPLSTLRSSNLLFAAVKLMHRASRTDFGEAKSILEHLADRESKHPRPHAWLANWFAMSVTQLQAQDRPGHIRRALDHSRRALDRDPDCALALAIDGVIHVNLLRDFEEGEKKLEAAVRANPSEGLAWLFKSVLHAFKGEGVPALQASQRALALSPLDPMRHYYESLAATAALGAGDYARAIQLASSSLRGNRTHPSTFRALALAQVMAGDRPGAADTVQQLLLLTPGYRVADFSQTSGFGMGPLRDVFSEALQSAGVPA